MRQDGKIPKRAKIIPVASTKRLKPPVAGRFDFFLHDFYTILFKISIALSSSRGYK